jgi:hypothetical protein
MAPHEWIRSGNAMQKLDAAGHQHDHTVIGPQPIWWDIAGTAVEWALPAEARDELAHFAGVEGSAQASYFRAAYAAFRGGVAKLGVELAASQSDERRDCQRALHYYRRWLDCELLRLEFGGRSISGCVHGRPLR